MDKKEKDLLKLYSRRRIDLTYLVPNNVRMNADQFIDKLRKHRPEAYRHTWDVYIEPYFWEDYEKLNDALKECVMMNIQVIQNSQTLPGKLIDSRLYQLDIGKGYSIIYRFSDITHEVCYDFIRKQKNADKGSLKISLPKVVRHPGAEDGIEDLIIKSYTGWFEDVTRNRLYAALKEKGVVE